MLKYQRQLSDFTALMAAEIFQNTFTLGKYLAVMMSRKALNHIVDVELRLKCNRRTPTLKMSGFTRCCRCYYSEGSLWWKGSLTEIERLEEALNYVLNLNIPFLHESHHFTVWYVPQFNRTLWFVLLEALKICETNPLYQNKTHSHQLLYYLV